MVGAFVGTGWASRWAGRIHANLAPEGIRADCPLEPDRTAEPWEPSMYKRLFVIAAALWLVTAVAAVALFVHGFTVPGSDGRTEIRLTVAERDFVLGEMRTMLSTVQGVIDGLAATDNAAIAKAAAGGGMAIETGVPLTLMAKLPLEFKQQGLAMHTGFDEIAAAAARGESAPALTRRLAGQINLCLGCHQSFRFNPTP